MQAFYTHSIEKMAELYNNECQIENTKNKIAIVAALKHEYCVD